MEALISLGEQHAGEAFWPCRDEAIAGTTNIEEQAMKQLFTTVSMSQEFTNTDAAAVDIYVKSHKHESDLLDFFRGQHTNQYPSLRLVLITGKRGPGRFQLDISREALNGLLTEMKVNPWAFWLNYHRCEGYHRMAAHDVFEDTRYFGTTAYVLIWTFSGQCYRSQTLLVDRAPLHHFHYLNVALQANITNLSNPYVPVFIAAYDVLLDLEESSTIYAGDVSELELRTGVSWSWPGPVEIDVCLRVDLTRTLSIEAGMMMRKASAMLRAHTHCMDALFEIERASGDEMCKIWSKYERPGITSGAAENGLSSAIDRLKMLSKSSASNIKELLERTEHLTNWLSATINHEDAIANLQAAEASMVIAKAMQSDSSAMKTIAFMTMAFLPATFLATLFALPILDWKHKVDVHVKGFQLFWIVAVFGTAFVFATWAVVTNWDRLNRKSIDLLLVHRRSSNVKTSDGNSASYGDSKASSTSFAASSSVAASVHSRISRRSATAATLPSALASRTFLNSGVGPQSLETSMDHRKASMTSLFARRTPRQSVTSVPNLYDRDSTISTRRSTNSV